MEDCNFVKGKTKIFVSHWPYSIIWTEPPTANPIYDPSYSNKGLNSNILLLKEKDRLLSNEKELPKLMNSFSINITAELELKKDAETFLGTSITSIVSCGFGRVYWRKFLDGKLHFLCSEVLEKFKYYPSLKRIRGTFNNNEKIPFLEIDRRPIKKKIYI